MFHAESSDCPIRTHEEEERLLSLKRKRELLQDQDNTYTKSKLSSSVEEGEQGSASEDDGIIRNHDHLKKVKKFNHHSNDETLDLKYLLLQHYEDNFPKHGANVFAEQVHQELDDDTSSEGSNEDEKFNQIWRVRKIRHFLSSLILGIQNWTSADSLKCLEMHSDQTSSKCDTMHLPTNDDTSRSIGEEDVTKKEHAIKLFSELFKKREMIESISLFLADRMVKRCQIHDEEFIKNLIRSNLRFEDEQNFDGVGWDLTGKTYNTPENWIKYILPQILKDQREENLLSDNTEEGNSEKLPSISEIDPGKEEILRYSFLDAFYLSPSILYQDYDIGDEIHQEQELTYSVESFEDLSDYEDVYVSSYLFNKTLADEKDFGSNYEPPFVESCLQDATPENARDHPFLSILEKTMRMRVKGSLHHEEHQDIEVSLMRLGVSLMILDCLNQELIYLLHRTTEEQYQSESRPLIRYVLDQFIDENGANYLLTGNASVSVIEGQLAEYTDLEGITKDLKRTFSDPFFHDSDSEEISDRDSDDYDSFDEGEDNNIIENYSMRYRGHMIQVDDTANTRHPLWYTHHTPSSTLKMYRKSKLFNSDTVPTSIASCEDWLYHGVGEESTSVADEEWVTFYRNFQPQNGEDNHIQSLDHVFETSIDEEHQNPESDSLHVDLMRLMRQAGILSCNEGSILEGFFILKSFIGKIIEYLQITKENNFVDKDDVICAIKALGLGKLYSPPRLCEFMQSVFTNLEPQFKSQPSIAPTNFSEVIYEDLNTFFENTNLEELDQTEDIEYNLCDYDTLVNNNTMADDITHFLNEDDPSYNDSYIVNSQSDKIGVYTPLIRSRCPSLYNDFFSTPEMRSKGLDISLVRDRLILEKFENICLEHDVVFAWIENIYLGVLENMFDKTVEEAKYTTLNALFSIWKPHVHAMEKRFIDDEDTIEQSQSGTPFEYLLDRIDHHDKCYTLNVLWKDDESKDFTLFIPIEESNTQQTNDSEQQKSHLDNELVVQQSSKHRIECKVHKFILSSRSPYFKQLMKGTFSEKQATEYNVGDFISTEKTLQLFVYYLYHNYLQTPTLPHTHPDFSQVFSNDMADVIEKSHQINTYHTYEEEDDEQSDNTMEESDAENGDSKEESNTMDHEDDVLSDGQNEIQNVIVATTGQISSMALNENDHEKNINSGESELQEEETTRSHNEEKERSSSPKSHGSEENLELLNSSVQSEADTNDNPVDGDSVQKEDTALSQAKTTTERIIDIHTNLEIFQTADFFMVQGLKDLAEHNIGHLICDENVIELLNLVLENTNFSKLFTTIDAYLLSSSNIESITNDIAQSEEMVQYYTSLSGTITRENVIDRLRYVFGVLDKVNYSDPNNNHQHAEEKSTTLLLHELYVQRLASFHKQKLVWFVVRNFDLFSHDQLALKELSEIPCTLITDQKKTNVLKVVEWLCDRYGYTFELIEHSSMPSS